MRINCPKCSAELELPDHAIGAKVRCGACGEKFIAQTQAPVVPKSAYVLPKGAQWDTPESTNEMVSPYSYYISCGGFSQAEVECEGCHNKFKPTFRGIIDLTGKPELTKALSNGDYFHFACPHCGKERIVIFKVFAFDLEKRYFIRTVFSDEEIQKFHQRQSMNGEALAVDSRAFATVRQRLVMGIPGLMEKLKVFEAGLDDYAVEMVKRVVLHHNQGLALKEIYFDGVEGENLKFRIELQDGRTGSTGAAMHMYDGVCTQMAGVGRFREGILRWVSHQMMAQNFDDWFEE